MRRKGQESVTEKKDKKGKKKESSASDLCCVCGSKHAQLYEFEMETES